MGKVPSKAERQVARSMALMETTDELFCNTMKLLADTNRSRNTFLDELCILYKEKIAEGVLRTDEKTNYVLFDEFRDMITDGLAVEIADFIDKKKYIFIKTKNRALSKFFFAQPGLLFAYWLADTMDKKDLQKRWPLPGYNNDLDVILSDLGT